MKIGDFEFPDDLYYYPEHHIWLKKAGGNVKLGMDDFGQKIAGKILFVRLRAAGKDVKLGKTFGTLETGKWVGPLKAPVAGTITEANPAVKDNPSLVNDDPYGEGWLLVVEPSNLDADMASLISGSDQDAVTKWIEEEQQKYADKLE
ncbi:MAG: glycine cleavage system protein H [Promethearchaeota archaeon]